MVREKHEYMCEVCSSSYGSRKEAEECEKKGVADEFKRGQVFAYGDDIVVLVGRKGLSSNWHGSSHNMYYDCFWFRDKYAGDSRTYEVENQSNSSIKGYLKSFKIKNDMPAFKRLKKFAKRKNIKLILEGVRFAK